MTLPVAISALLSCNPVDEPSDPSLVLSGGWDNVRKLALLYSEVQGCFLTDEDVGALLKDHGMAGEGGWYSFCGFVAWAANDSAKGRNGSKWEWWTFCCRAFTPSLLQENFQRNIADDSLKVTVKGAAKTFRPEKAWRLLKDALNDRVVNVNVVGGSRGSPGTFLVTLLLNDSNSGRLVDKCGSDLTKEEAFRKLWKDAACLRRFQDGSVQMSAVWDASPPDTFRVHGSYTSLTIPERILGHILTSHGLCKDENIVFHGDEIKGMISSFKGGEKEDSIVKLGDRSVCAPPLSAFALNLLIHF